MRGYVILAGALLFAPSELGAQKKETDPVYRSPIHIALSPDGATAYVVNQGSDSVSILDVRARKVVGEISVGSHPTHAELSPDGRTLYVTSTHGGTVEVVNVDRKSTVRTIQTGLEPYGAGISKDGATLYVANDMSDSVSILDVKTGRAAFTVGVGRSPRYVARTPDGSRLIVANGMTRGVSIIDLVSGKVVETRRLGKASLLRQLVCSPDGKWAFVAHIVSHDEAKTLQMERGWINSNGISILDLEKPGHYVTLLLDRLLKGAANPWGMALSADGSKLYVSLAGAHEVAIVDVRKALELVAETKPDQVLRLSENVEIVEKRGIAVRVDAGGLGPRGIALSQATEDLLVANYFSDDVSILDPKTGELRAVVPLGPKQKMTLWRKGQLTFNDARICYQGWYSCASCHQEDATVDGLNWDLFNDGLGNAKNAKSMHEIHDTPPAMWGGVRKDMDAAVQAGQRFLGLIPDANNHRALIEFIGNPRRAPNPYRKRAPTAVQRGQKVFERARCVACHPAPTYTDEKKHDVGLAAKTDLRSRFDTPTVREIYRTAPYLHDGRAPTLRQIFTEHNPKDLHGRTSGLSADELDDLLEFLRSL